MSTTVPAAMAAPNGPADGPEPALAGAREKDPAAGSPEEGALMAMMACGKAAGWGGSGPRAAGCQGLLEDVMAAARWSGGAVEKTDALEGVLRRASETFQAAEAKLLTDGLVCCEDWLSLRDTFFATGSLFAVAGYPDAAAKSFLHATFINSAFKGSAEDEARMTLTQCVENLKTLHPALAVEALLRLAESYERSGTNSRHEENRRGGFPPLLWQAARCRKEAAELTDHRLNDHAAAIPLYETAIETFKRAGGEKPFRNADLKHGGGGDAESPVKGDKRASSTISVRPLPTDASSRRFLDMYKSFVSNMQDRLGILYTELEEYEKAELLFVEKARCTACGLPATKYYLYATLCVLVRGFGDEDSYFNSLYYTKKIFDRYQTMDKGFQKGKENELMRSILQAFDNNSLNSFDIALNMYTSYATTQSNLAFDELTVRCRQNLLDHLERYA